MTFVTTWHYRLNGVALIRLAGSATLIFKRKPGSTL